MSVRSQENIGLFDVLSVIAKHRAMIIGMTLGGTILCAAISLVMPNVYTATARILPPQQSQSAATVMLGQLTGLAGLASSPLGLRNPNELYVGMLKSRTVADNIIANFDLSKVYGHSTLTETRKELASNSTITAGKDGLVTIEFDDPSPARAAAIANSYVAELDKLTQTLAVTEAAQRRLFFERQLQKSRVELTEAETALKKTQEKTGLIKLDDQGRAIIEAVAALRAQISAKQVELRAMRTFTTGSNPEFVRTQQQLAGLRSELRKLEQAQTSGSDSLLLPTGAVPEAGLEYLRRLRDVKYQETVLELLARQFEAAKIDESNDAAIVQVVDRAIEPDKKSKPYRGLITVGGALVALCLAILVALMRETPLRDKEGPATST